MKNSKWYTYAMLCFGLGLGWLIPNIWHKTIVPLVDGGVVVVCAIIGYYCVYKGDKECKELNT